MRQRLFLAFVAVLPLHTVYLSAWISWKPFMVLLALLAAMDLRDGLRRRAWPWHRPTTVAFLFLLAAVALGFPEPGLRERYFRLALALVVGFGVMVVTEKALRLSPSGSWGSTRAKRGGGGGTASRADAIGETMVDKTLRVIFWTASAMAVTGLVFSTLLLGFAGADTVNYLSGAQGFDVPLLDKVGKPAYLLSGFLALSNWHQDPGYGAAWMVLWSTLAFLASLRGLGTKSPLIDGALLGLMWASVVMAFARTGWVALLVALMIVAWKVRHRGVWKRIAAGLVTLVITIAFFFATDVRGVGGELPVQFAFRLRQGWDLVASLTGLFATSEAFEDQFNESEQRADVWPEYWELFLENPITGAGLGVGWETNSVGQEPHNLFLELGAETGLLGLAAFVALIIVIARAGSGLLGGIALAVALLPVMTQTVLFEPSWWFAAGLYLARTGKFQLASEMPLESSDESGVVTPEQSAA